MKKYILAAAVAAFCAGQISNAQTNLQVFHDFGDGRSYATATIEGLYNDNWGDTFFFADFYFRGTKEPGKNEIGGPSNGSYFEIERGINFWKNSALKDLSIHVEYDGGTWGASVASLGAKYLFHSADFRNIFQIAVMYDWMWGQSCSIPVKVSGVWGFNKLFGVEGLCFKGFFDVWGLDSDFADGSTKLSFLSEPQIWYNVGRHIGVKNLDLGGEVELSVNFAGHKGFMCNPCIGARWTF